MMTESDAKSVEHMRLVRLLRPLLVGYLVAVEVIVRGIWDQFVNRFVPSNAPRGDVGRFSNADIAEGVGWHGDADHFIQAMIEAGRLVLSDEHRLVVADWHKLAPGYLRSNIKHQGGFIGAPDSSGRNEDRNALEVPQENPSVDHCRNAGPSDTRCDLPNVGRNGERNGERDDAVYSPPCFTSPYSASTSSNSSSYGWEEAEAELASRGVSAAKATVRDADQAGLTPADVRKRVAEFDATPKAWGPGALAQVASGKLHAWPQMSAQFEKQQASVASTRVVDEIRVDNARRQALNADYRKATTQLEVAHGPTLDALDQGSLRRLFDDTFGASAEIEWGNYKRRGCVICKPQRNELINRLASTEIAS